MCSTLERRASQLNGEFVHTSDLSWTWIVPSQPGGYTLAHSLVRECATRTSQCIQINPLEASQSIDRRSYSEIVADAVQSAETDVVVVLDLGFIKLNRRHRFRRRRNIQQILVHFAGDDPQAFSPRRLRSGGKNAEFGRPRGNLSVARDFDLTLTSDWGSFNAYSANNLRALWFPYWFDTSLAPSRDEVPSYDVVSSMNPRGSRTNIVRALERQSSFSFRNVTGVSALQAAQHLARGSIVLNIAAHDEITIRVFETLGLGKLLATNYTSSRSGMDLLFDENRHYWTVSEDEKQLIPELERMLGQKVEHLELAQLARTHVENFHTEFHRFQYLLQAVERFWCRRARLSK